MTKYKVQSAPSLMNEMRAVARGEKRAPKDAGKVSFNSAGAIMRLLTTENRKLMAIIRDEEPDSIAELVKMTGRAQPNLTRTLAKLEAAGFVKSKASGKRKTLRVSIKKLIFEIDPFSESDAARRLT